MAAVLVVEDEAQVLTLAQSYLEEHGHKTLSSSTVDGALALLEGSEQIDLLFTEIGPHSDLHGGIELARKAAESRRGLKVLYTTGQAVTDGMKALMVEGSAVLEKPYTVDQLKTILSDRFGIESQPS
jgi:CheY-like chemotaxis protein